MNPEERLTVAIVDDAHKTDTPQGRAIKRIIDGLRVCNSDHITQSCRGDDAMSLSTYFLMSASCSLARSFLPSRH